MANKSLNYRSAVAQQFHYARRQASMEALMARLTGQSANLLSYEEVAKALRVRGQASAGQQEVPISAIIGSVGRYNDFTRSFLPLQDSDESRWVSVHMAASHVGDLPPVELYRIGESYFVLDGNHRISIAMREGLEFIDAYVTEIYTRVPLPPGASPDALIIAAEYAAFLDWTQLDRHRNDVDLTVSVPGQYARLEDHVEAYRFMIEMDESIEPELPAAAERWYDEVYLPLAQAIREQGILRYFPGRTETDFFVWLASHRADLQSELGITLTPEATVSQLLMRVREPSTNVKQPATSRLRRVVDRLTATQQEAERIEQSWSQVRSIARYSDRLFSDIMVPIDLAAGGYSSSALRHSQSLGAREDARVTVVAIMSENGSSEAQAEALQRIRDQVNSAQADGFGTILMVETGPLTDIIGRMSPYYDLLVLDRAFGLSMPGASPNAALITAIQTAQRPALVIGDRDERPMCRISVVVDDSPQGREGLFIAAYLAEQRQIDLVLVSTSRGREASAAIEYARAYIAMHEMMAEVIVLQSASAIDALPGVISSQACDLLVVPGLHQGKKSDQTRQLTNLLNGWPHSLLIANWA